jgi:hypothetical protein
LVDADGRIDGFASNVISGFVGARLSHNASWEKNAIAAILEIYDLLNVDKTPSCTDYFSY